MLVAQCLISIRSIICNFLYVGHDSHPLIAYFGKKLIGKKKIVVL